jgi:hypothetical protein
MNNCSPTFVDTTGISPEDLTRAYWSASQIMRAPEVGVKEYKRARDFLIWLSDAAPEDAPEYLRVLARCDLYELAERSRPDSNWRRVDEVAAYLVERNRPKSHVTAAPGDGPGDAA